eukprot:6208827-Pleurochrysis_carterae.AAC.1
MKHDLEVPQLLYDPGLTAAMRTAQLNFNVVVNNTFLRLHLWCSETKQIKESDDLCRYMAERHLSKYTFRLPVSSPVQCYLEPEDLVADADGSSDSTFSDDDDAGPSVQIPELAPESADAEPLKEAGASSAPPRVRWACAVDECEERWKDMQACMEAMEARTKRN